MQQRLDILTGPAQWTRIIQSSGACGAVAGCPARHHMKRP
jgi:hypothetical protein